MPRLASALLYRPVEKYMGSIIDKMVWEKSGVEKFGKMLDLAAYRHKLISGNVANAATPGYASQDVDFNTEMKKALGTGPVLPMKVTDPKHLPNSGAEASVKVIEHGPESEDDLNGVDIDTEITNLAVNEMNYTVGARLLEKNLTGLKKAITGRT